MITSKRPAPVLWVLAITNAFNLIDGLDGLAAGSALFSTLVALVVALLSGTSLPLLMAHIIALPEQDPMIAAQAG